MIVVHTCNVMGNVDTKLTYKHNHRAKILSTRVLLLFVHGLDESIISILAYPLEQ